MLAMNFPVSSMQQQQQQQQAQQAPQHPPQMVAPAPPTFVATSSLGSASSAFSAPGTFAPPMQLVTQQSTHGAAHHSPLTAASFHAIRQGAGGEKRCRADSSQDLQRLSGSSSIHSAPPSMMLQQQPAVRVSTSSAASVDTQDSHESSSKKRRSANYVAPRTVPTTFTSVTVPTGPGNLRRNLSFSRIDPYVSYAQTPSLTTTTTTGGDGTMDMDASSGNQSSGALTGGAGDSSSRVRSMSF